ENTSLCSARRAHIHRLKVFGARRYFPVLFYTFCHRHAFATCQLDVREIRPWPHFPFDEQSTKFSFFFVLSIPNKIITHSENEALTQRHFPLRKCNKCTEVIRTE